MAQQNVVQIFRRGVPTGPDVDKLMTLNLKPGDRIGYGQVERIIGARQTEHRFRTVTNSWRKRVFREQSLEVKAEGGMFIALTAREALSQRVVGMGKLRRAASRETIRAGVIDATQLTAAESERHMLLRRHAASLLGHAQDACRAIAPPKAVQTK